MEVEVTQQFKVKCSNCSFREIGIATKEGAIEIAKDHLRDWKSGNNEWHELKISEVTLVKKEEDED